MHPRGVRSKVSHFPSVGIWEVQAQHPVAGWTYPKCALEIHRDSSIRRSNRCFSGDFFDEWNPTVMGWTTKTNDKKQFWMMRGAWSRFCFTNQKKNNLQINWHKDFTNLCSEMSKKNRSPIIFDDVTMIHYTQNIPIWVKSKGAKGPLKFLSGSIQMLDTWMIRDGFWYVPPASKFEIRWEWVLLGGEPQGDESNQVFAIPCSYHLLCSR